MAKKKATPKRPAGVTKAEVKAIVNTAIKTYAKQDAKQDAKAEKADAKKGK